MTKLHCSTCGTYCVGFNSAAVEWDWPYRCFYCEPWGQPGDTGPKPPMALDADAIRAEQVRRSLEPKKSWWQGIFT